MENPQRVGCAYVNEWHENSLQELSHISLKRQEWKQTAEMASDNNGTDAHAYSFQ